MHYLRTLIVLILCFSCDPSGPLDSGPLKTSNGSAYHWIPRRFPIKVMVLNTLPEDLKANLLVATGIWTDLVGAQVFDVHEVDSSFPMADTGVAMRGYIMVNQQDLGSNTYGRIRGLAEVHTMPGNLGLYGEIHSAHLWYDNDYLNDLTSVSIGVHELGHCLGLTHDRHDQTSIMWFNVSNEAQVQQEDIVYVRNQMDFLVDIP